jgi:hypothetical protein
VPELAARLRASQDGAWIEAYYMLQDQRRLDEIFERGFTADWAPKSLRAQAHAHHPVLLWSAARERQAARESAAAAAEAVTAVAALALAPTRRRLNRGPRFSTQPHFSEWALQATPHVTISAETQRRCAGE